MSKKIFTVNFVDPSKTTVDLSPSALSGPSGTASRRSDLDLMGMGHSLWGEYILNDILHLLENFACSEDLHSIIAVSTGAGTLTFSGDVTKSFVSGETFEIINSDTNNGTWTVASLSSYNDVSDETTVTVVEALNATSTYGQAGQVGIPNRSLFYGPTTPTEGQIWYNQTRQQAFVYRTTTGSPITGSWDRINGLTVGSTQPTTPSQGDLWWDTTTYAATANEYGRNLKIYVSGAWVRVVENYLPLDGSKTVQGNINMGGFLIENVGNPNTSDDALNLGYADGRYVNVTGDTMTGILNMGANRIENVGNPNTNDDALNLGYADGRYVNVTGDIMTGILNMGANRIENLASPNSSDDALNLGYADGRYVNVTGDTMTGYLTLNANPTANLHSATKQYVDTEVSSGVAGVTDPVRTPGYNVEAIAYSTGNWNSGDEVLWTIATFTSAATGDFIVRVRCAGFADNQWLLYKNATQIASVFNTHSGTWTYDRYLSDKIVSLVPGDVLTLKFRTKWSGSYATGGWIHVMSDYLPLSSMSHTGTQNIETMGGRLDVTPLSPANENNTLTW